MGFPVLTAVMLMTGASPDAGALPPVLTPVLALQTISDDQDVTAATVPPKADASILTNNKPDSKPEDQNIITVSGSAEAPPGDPLEQVNAQTFEVVQKLDKAMVAPVARAYEKSVPSPVRSGIRNFLNNLFEPVVFINYLLQLKPGKAAETAGRFVLNSTIGVAGIVDVAKTPSFNLPYRPNGLANTLGYYGVKPGPFLYLPLVGATTLRDVLGDAIDRMVVPFAVGKPFNRLAYAIPTTVVSLLDSRVEFDAQLRSVREGSDDPYAASRDFYLKTRQAEIDALRGKVTTTEQPVTETVADPVLPTAPLPD